MSDRVPVKFYPPTTNGWQDLADRGIEADLYSCRWLVLEKLKVGTSFRTYTNQELKSMGKSFNWCRLPNIERVVFVELAVDRANAYVAARTDKVGTCRLFLFGK